MANRFNTVNLRLILQSPDDCNLRLLSHKYKQFASKYAPRVVIYNRRGFIRRGKKAGREK